MILAAFSLAVGSGEPKVIIHADGTVEKVVTEYHKSGATVSRYKYPSVADYKAAEELTKQVLERMSTRSGIDDAITS